MYSTKFPVVNYHIWEPCLLFLSLDWSRSKDPRRPLAMASIEAYFRKNQTGNIKAEFKNFNLNSPNFNLRDVLEVIDETQPKFLALGAYIWNEKYVPDIIRWTKDHHPGTVIILGGPQVTYGNCDLMKEYPGVAYFIRGEGEVPFTELINALYRCEIPDREFLDKYAIYTPEILNRGICDRIFTVKLDTLESPYLNHILPIEQNQAFVRWETLRRCPYRCSFCQYHLAGHKMGEINHGLFRELEYFKERKVQEINVLDPIFNLRPDHYLEICKKIDACGIQARFYFQCRLELLCSKGGKQFLEFCRDHDVWLDLECRLFKKRNPKPLNEETIIPKYMRQLNFYTSLTFPLISTLFLACRFSR